MMIGYRKEEGMKIAILGAGAMGSILAAYLARAGEDVSIIARGGRAENIKQKGITIEGWKISMFHARLSLTPIPFQRQMFSFTR